MENITTLLSLSRNNSISSNESSNASMMKSTSEDYNHENSELEVVVKSFFILLRITSQVLGMLSNLALIVSVMKFGHLQQIHNLIITSLSFADGFFLLYETVIRVPQSITETFTSHQFSIHPWHCNVNLMQNTFVTCQLLHLLLVALDRFLFIHRPIQYSMLDKKKLALVILLCWILGIVPLSLVNFLVCQDYRESAKMAFGRNVKIYQRIIGNSFLTWFVLLFLIYTNVFWTLRRIIKRQKEQSRPKIEPPTRMERNRCLRVQRQVSPVPCVYSEVQRTLLKGYAIRMLVAFIPQLMRYLTVMINRQSTSIGTTIWSVVIAQVVLLTMVTASSTSAFIHCFTQSSLKEGMKRMLADRNRTPTLASNPRRNQFQMTSAPRVTPLKPV